MQSASPTSRADQPTEAGLVIEYDDGRIATFCVDTGDPFGMTAEQLLLAAPLETQMFREYGSIFVCRIGDRGCPRDNCLCAYAGDAPQSRLWMSYRLRNGVWQRPEPAEVNLSRRRVFPGDVEAWVWGYPGDGHGQGAAQPSRVIAFAQICAAATPAPTLTTTPTPTDTAMPTDTPAPTDTPRPADTAPPAPAPPTPPLEQNAPIILPAASPTRQSLPTFVRPSPTATLPARETRPAATAWPVHLPLVRGAAEQPPPPIDTPPVVALERATALPTPTAIVPASPTPRLDLTATAAILQTEFAVPPAPATPTGAGGKSNTGGASATSQTVAPPRATPTPRPTRPAAGGVARPEAMPYPAPLAYPASPAASPRRAELPRGFVLWLGLGLGVYLLALLALILAQRRASRSLNEDDGDG
ncbi:MAG: hypothetical protein RMK84_06215 [Oscillochloridaceae bacterium]|nr:hypothetical protein [Chloroflexaceae bacterium]MDW8389701.1 hypothetical protein [Oscillochloridaceae bacterium]